MKMKETNKKKESSSTLKEFLAKSRHLFNQTMHLK